MGSCGFHGSRKAIFTRFLLDDSDESHLMKKKADLRAASSSSWGDMNGPQRAVSGRSTVKGWRTGPPWSQGWAPHCWGCCQYMLTHHWGAQVEPRSQKWWGGTERQLLRTHLNSLQAAVSDSTASIIKLHSSLLLWFTTAPTANYRFVESFKVEKTPEIIKCNH